MKVLSFTREMRNRDSVAESLMNGGVRMQLISFTSHSTLCHKSSAKRMAFLTSTSLSRESLVIWAPILALETV